MKIYRLIPKIALTLLLLLGFYACSNHSPQPQNPVLQAAPITDAQREAAQDWFVDASHFKPIHIDWEKASTVGELIVAPLLDTSNPFTSKQKQGYRYLVAKLANNGKTAGHIVELVLDGQKLSPEEATKLAADAVQPVIAGGPSLNLPGVSGWVILYSPAYTYEVGYIYQAGVLQPKRVKLTASSSTGIPTSSQRTNLIQYISVTICGLVNGQLNNCVTDTYSIDTGSGGGSGGSGGTSSTGGGGDNGNNWGGMDGTTTPIADDGPLDIGAHSKILTIKYDNSTTIKVLLEWTKSPPKIEKISTTVVGLIALTPFLQLGDGTASYMPNKFSNGDDMIRYTVYFQWQAGINSTGPIANGTIFRLSGRLDADTGQYTINMVKMP